MDKMYEAQVKLIGYNNRLNGPTFFVDVIFVNESITNLYENFQRFMWWWSKMENLKN